MKRRTCFHCGTTSKYHPRKPYRIAHDSRFRKQYMCSECAAKKDPSFWHRSEFHDAWRRQMRKRWRKEAGLVGCIKCKPGNKMWYCWRRF